MSITPEASHNAERNVSPAPATVIVSRALRVRITAQSTVPATGNPRRSPKMIVVNARDS